jgi:hypothetical protein
MTTAVVPVLSRDPYAAAVVLGQCWQTALPNTTAGGYGSPRPVRNCALGGDDERYEYA